MMPLRYLLLATVVVCNSGCSMMIYNSYFSDSDKEAEPQATLADLSPAIMPDKTAELPAVDLDTLVATYEEVLEVTDDADIRLRVQRRLAGLEMKRGEQQLYEQEAVGGQFGLAISAYQSLLNNHPNHPGNDRLLYQLSKAYDLEGNSDQSMLVLDQLVTDYPSSGHYGEAQFRRAEIFFSRGDYPNAGLAYNEVIRQGANHQHYQNALYMYGWSLFKQERYRASLKPFSQVLDNHVPADNNVQTLERGQRELTQDVFKVMSIVFSYLDGANTIAEVYDSLGERHYLPLLYDNLGQHYLKQERYRDSAEAYRAYINRYPSADQSPVFYARLIDAYIAGGFPDDVLQEKENYINSYGIYSDYWQQKTEQSRDYIRPFLEQYLPELARHYHAKAQGGREGLAAPKNNQLKQQERTRLEAVAVSDFLTAGNYYQQFIDTFPEDDQVPEMHFLFAESRFEAGVFDEAIEAYEVVAYKYPDDKRGASAGYSAIVAYGFLLQQLPEASKQVVDGISVEETWVRLKIASQLRFASTYQYDPRAAAVLTKSAEELLALKEYQHAIAAARQLTRRDPPAEQGLRKTAWIVIGHSAFELQQYDQAENAYQQTLQVLAPNDSDRQAIVDRLAASVYKQAEQALAAGDAVLAVKQFLRVADVAPSSAISATARYDAANTLMASANYGSAIVVMDAFRNDYPDNPLSADIPAKMVVAYEANGEWAKAGDELTAIYQSSEDEAIKQESLYQAAENYAKAGDKPTAILRYRSYAHAYPQPFPIAMEARYQLSELYLDANEDYKRRFWLKKMIAADKGAGVERTERSRYLAAFSSSVLADDEYQRFKQQRLTLPLKNSLKKKKSALDKTLKAYNQVVDYGVEEFATLATYRIASVYSQLSKDLMSSQRPGNLDALALEQYDILLEEQAFPFEEKAIAIHEANIQRSWAGVYDAWVKKSFAAMSELLPARYGKKERQGDSANAIY
ncbi:hypothetical protein BST96_00865 [Oceanicoccus sagamiensis]|uniref:Outer membrane lipoprotein BamD-like domain-containing protein n=1 Tax=Oceanicoccus sagamiensis TaxID=716816 RepID=A0A1X9NDY1_9GAMM|nr:hypothetical protein BST96_00865 [Oceanicoccus sagamiensis]